MAPLPDREADSHDTGRDKFKTQHLTSTHPLLIVEPNLSHRHRPVLLQVRPRRVDNRHIVPLVPYTRHITSATLTSNVLEQDHTATSNKHPRASLYSRRCSALNKQRKSRTKVPSIEFALVNCAQSSTSSVGKLSHACPSWSRR